ncbi:hypothetical protein [Streptomyces griseomycini]|uniref:Uncharacterized protein n=1 Tax=Streptomyces griseomycini TaxID=66895 RepID=A0A7W7M0J7_9ACTN|nr:hypothetical protein [Streptomyces griseomycini]MBB4899757.1 hypothetical protein [Streptomyces griseomycini]GGP97182.1 hypothetical protein GCM10010266_20450 [Streptomyces griseomycini]GGR06944.1 hypothetical protein GCM10015536_09820 [Streptomyces griseomycini]
MAMVGLFWITEDAVYLGAEPRGSASGVRFTEDGVEALGTDPGGFWAWDGIVGIDVDDVPVRSAARRLASMVFDSVVVALTGEGELPPGFTVRLTTGDGMVEVGVFTAAAGGIYEAVEYELSTAVLGRLADGGTGLDDLLAWGRDHAAAGTPDRGEREALLRGWAGDRCAS